MPPCRRSRSTRPCAIERARHRPVPPSLGRPAAAGRRRVSSRPTSWLADPALTRIWQVLRERLEGRGLRAEGRVVLSGLSREERHAVSALVGRPVTTARLALSLADVDTTLAERSGIGGLQAVLEHVTGHALDDRAARRAQLAAGREAPFTLARGLVGDAPWVEAWLDG